MEKLEKSNKTVIVVWDRRYFEPNVTDFNATITINVKYVDDPDDRDALSVKDIPNSRGYQLIHMDEKWLEGGQTNNLTLSIASSNSLRSPGPRFVLHPNSDPQKNETSSDEKPSKVGMGVGIPIGLAFIAVVAFGLFYFLRKRRRGAVGAASSRGQGYLTGRSRSQRTGEDGGIQLDEDEFVGGTRGPERFRDEPTHGVELQDRSRGRVRDDSFESLPSSPGPENFAGHRQGTSTNAFRDEIARQRATNV